MQSAKGLVCAKPSDGDQDSEQPKKEPFSFALLKKKITEFDIKKAVSEFDFKKKFLENLPVSISLNGERIPYKDAKTIFFSAVLVFAMIAFLINDLTSLGKIVSTEVTQPKFVRWVENIPEFCKQYQEKNSLLKCLEKQELEDEAFSYKVIVDQAYEIADLGIRGPLDISVGIEADDCSDYQI